MKHSYLILSLSALLWALGANGASLPDGTSPRVNHHLQGKPSVKKEIKGNRVVGERLASERPFSLSAAPSATMKTREDAKMKAPGAGPTYTVTCVFEGEDWPYFAIYNEGFFVETSYSVWEESEFEDTYFFEIPAGTYDIATSFYSYDEHTNGYIFHENVEINSDITISFSSDEATETVTFVPMLRNGEEAVLPVGKELDEAPWMEIDETKATALYFGADYLIAKEGCEEVFTGMIMADFTFENENPRQLTLLTSKTSDKYHLVVNTFIKDKEEEYEIATSDVAGLYTREAPSYNKDFVKFPMPSFADTPINKEFGVEKYHSSVSGLYWVNDVQKGGGGLYTESLQPVVYVASQPVEYCDLKTVVCPSSVQAEMTVTFEEEDEDETYTWTEIMRAEMYGLPVWYNGKEWEYINQNHSQCGNWSFQAPESGPVLEYPGLEPYCFTPDEITQPFGNSAPILVVMTQTHDYDGEFVVSVSPQALVGRYGEVRNCDSWDQSFVVKNKDGNVLYDSEEDGYLDEWVYDYFTGPHDKGLLSATYTDNNVLVDGTVKGYNKTYIEYDETRDDCYTPTPQMLIFKNKKGEITDRFNEAKDGVMEFSAGDFNFTQTPDDWYYTVAEAEITVDYSPYGEGKWNAVDFEEVPEYFYMPGFGYFYRASLEGVTLPSSNGWYDLRMTLKDKAGNLTVEEISPAFKIGDGTGAGLKNLLSSDLSVINDHGMIRVLSESVASMELISPDGKRMGRTSGNQLSASGYHGVLLVRVMTRDGGVSVHRLIL